MRAGLWCLDVISRDMSRDNSPPPAQTPHADWLLLCPAISEKHRATLASIECGVHETNRVDVSSEVYTLLLLEVRHRSPMGVSL